MTCPKCGATIVYDPEDEMFVCSAKLMDQDLDGHYPAKTDEGRDQLKEGRVSGSADRLNRPFQQESRLMQGQSPRVNPDRVVPEVSLAIKGKRE